MVFRSRRLGHLGFPYVYAATDLHAREAHHVVSKAVVRATGISQAGMREVLGLAVGDSEDEAFWSGFLRALRARGLSGVQLVISDQHAGLVAAIRKVLQGAAHQRCRVHFARNLPACVPKGQQEMVAAAFRTIFAYATKEEIAEQWDHVDDTLAERFPKAAALMHCAKEEVLVFSAFPKAHWRQLWSTNALSVNRSSIPRAGRVGGICPNEAAVIRLAGAALIDVQTSGRPPRGYFSEASMDKLAERDDDPVVTGELVPAD